ncbi:UNVERIFIED_CONTAM: hypothetical protein GTU68_053417, partial [Idotea baltica]|nr:hypothetical protein [Idotea baltica]
GFDWLLIDGEHAPNDLRSILPQLQVVGASNSHPIVRVPIGETYMIKQVLDAGAQSLLIPMVESGEQAKDLVKATRYPPNGVRGVGSALARASNFNAIPDYLTTADEQICLTVQLESRAGIDALDDILAVDGVDGVFIGPSDLAADMGMLGKADTPEMQALINDLLTRIKASGKAAGILALTTESVAHAQAAGACFIGVGIDVLLFAQSMRKLAANPSKPT